MTGDAAFLPVLDRPATEKGYWRAFRSASRGFASVTLRTFEIGICVFIFGRRGFLSFLRFLDILRPYLILS